MIVYFIFRRLPRPPLFPYTTLFRSSSARRAPRRGLRADPPPRPPRAPRGDPRARSPGSCGRARREPPRSEEHTSELQSHVNLVCRLLLEKKKTRGSQQLQVSSEPPA